MKFIEKFIWRFVVGCLILVILVNTSLAASFPLVWNGGKVRSNSWVHMEVPQPNSVTPVIVDIKDSNGQTIWTGASRSNIIEFYTRDWADGIYTVDFQPGGVQTIEIDTLHFDAFRARSGLMLRAIDDQRDANGAAPSVLAGKANELQRWEVFQIYWDYNNLSSYLHGAEQSVGFSTASASVRILGSGSSRYTGYNGPYRPFLRERAGMYMPPNAVFDFGANTERKLTRWGYGINDVDHVFITHPHADHFSASAIASFAAKRINAGLGPLTVHSGNEACNLLEGHLGSIGQLSNVIIDRMSAGGETTAGELRVKAVAGNHSTANPLCYIIHYRDATVYYGTDTGYPSAATYSALAQESFDVFVHELTTVTNNDLSSHVDVGDFRLLLRKLRGDGAINQWTRVVTIHQDNYVPFQSGSADVLADYPHFQQMLGFEAGYDGMLIPFAYRLSCWDCQGQRSGDANGDGTVGLEDLAMLGDLWLNDSIDAGYNCCCDFNRDDEINYLDVSVISLNWRSQGLGSCSYIIRSTNN